MSENLNDTVTVLVEDASVITVPIDDTLQNSGEAADAKAVGDALALKADASQVTGITVNGQSADQQGVIIVTAAETAMSDTDSSTIKAKIEALETAVSTTPAADVLLYETGGAETIKNHVDGLATTVAAIGTVITGTVDEDMEDPSGGWKDAATISLPGGTWVLWGGLEYVSAFTSGYAGCAVFVDGSMINGSRLRSVGTSGGGLAVTIIVSHEATTTYTLRASQTSGSSQTMQRVTLQAVKIA